MNKVTLAKEYQNYLYGLLQVHLLTLDGPTLVGPDGAPVTFVSREELMDKIIVVLNEFGKSVASDKRFSHEIDKGASEQVSGSTEAGNELSA